MFLTTIVFLITLSTLVLIHELGHFLAAKRAGIKVEEFGFGYPPRIWAKKIGETVYSVNWVLFGGFVRLFGEELADERGSRRRKTWKKAFWAKSKKARMGVILAGVTANFLLAIFLFSTVYSVSGIPTETDQVKIVGVVPDSPAEQVGLKEMDLVLAVEGEKIENVDRFVELIDQKKGSQVRITVARDKDNPCLEKVLGGGGPPPPEEVGPVEVGYSCEKGDLVFFLTPRSEPPEREGPLGVVISSVEMAQYPFWQMPFRGAWEGMKEAFGWTQLIVSSLGGMLADLVVRGVVPEDVAGPVGIFQITGMVAQTGVLNILRFIGILSVNLAIVNVLPIPAFDGGRLVFVVYEAVIRRRPRPSFERWVNAAGMALIVTLIILVTLNDIARLVDLGAVLTKLRSNLTF